MIGSVSCASALGGRSIQEDRAIYRRIDDVGWLLAVLDGHGGDAVSALCAQLLAGCELLPATSIRSLVEAAAREGREFADAGTTLSAALIRTDEMAVEIAVLGDSPVLVGCAQGETFISARHVGWENERERTAAVARGAIFHNGYLFNRTAAGDRDLERGAVLLTRGVGSKRFAFLEERPDVEALPLDDHSFVFIASDGVLFEPSRRDARAFAEIVRSRVVDGWTAEMFVSEAVEAGVRDNVSVVLWRANYRCRSAPSA